MASELTKLGFQLPLLVDLCSFHLMDEEWVRTMVDVHMDDAVVVPSNPSCPLLKENLSKVAL